MKPAVFNGAGQGACIVRIIAIRPNPCTLFYMIKNIVKRFDCVRPIADGLPQCAAFPDLPALVGRWINDGSELKGNMAFGDAQNALGRMLMNLQKSMEVFRTYSQRENQYLLNPKALKQMSSNNGPILRFKQIRMPIHNAFGVFQPALGKWRACRRPVAPAWDMFVVIAFAPSARVARQPLAVGSHHAVIPVSPGFPRHGILHR